MKTLFKVDHMTDKIRLNPPETAPKNGAIILAEFGDGRLMPAMWCFYSKVWVIAMPTVDVVTAIPTYERFFLNETEEPNRIRGWLSIPTDWFFHIRDNQTPIDQR
jgi:hypothetical protein